MDILLIGEDVNFRECEEKFGPHQYTYAHTHREAEKYLNAYELVIDFIIDEEPDHFDMYAESDGIALLNNCKVSLNELAFMVGHQVKGKIFGFNGLPTFLNRPLVEVSLLEPTDEPALRLLFNQLNSEYVLVDDRVGYVTPRIICMIINEAYFALQEGISSREEIDTSMKLGTNYPYGPFEWCEKIGVRHVYEVLEALHDDHKSERYKICPLLKKAYLRS